MNIDRARRDWLNSALRYEYQLDQARREYVATANSAKAAYKLEQIERLADLHWRSVRELSHPHGTES